MGNKIVEAYLLGYMQKTADLFDQSAQVDNMYNKAAARRKAARSRNYKVPSHKIRPVPKAVEMNAQRTYVPTRFKDKSRVTSTYTKKPMSYDEWYKHHKYNDVVKKNVDKYWQKAYAKDNTLDETTWREAAMKRAADAAKKKYNKYTTSYNRSRLNTKKALNAANRTAVTAYNGHQGYAQPHNIVGSSRFNKYR
jgi:hypothetical protein